jgi:DNA polymerase III sliding clamp (beta) subunit (PCNA family)
MTATATPTMTDLAITANTADLRDCLAAVALAAKPRGPLPTLACVLLSADGGTLELRCTDLATTIRRITRQVQVDAPGAVCVKAHELLDWLKMVDDATVKLNTEGDRMHVVGDDSGKRSFYTIPDKDFPPAPPEEKEVATITLSLDALRLACSL